MKTPLPLCFECWDQEPVANALQAAFYLLVKAGQPMTTPFPQQECRLHCVLVSQLWVRREKKRKAHLRAPKAAFLTEGSLSDRVAAIAGKALEGSHAPIPDFFRMTDNSSNAYCRVFATLAFRPCSSRSWNSLL